jgi:hypothetical protein
MRVLICGGRDFQDYLHFASALRAAQAIYGQVSVVIHGAAKGADHCAHLWATSAGNKHIEEIKFPAEWKKHGRAAGPIRNQQMIDEGKPDLVIAFPGGRGTEDMLFRSQKAGIEVMKVMGRERMP